MVNTSAHYGPYLNFKNIGVRLPLQLRDVSIVFAPGLNLDINIDLEDKSTSDIVIRVDRRHVEATDSRGTALRKVGSGWRSTVPMSTISEREEEG